MWIARPYVPSDDPVRRFTDIIEAIDRIEGFTHSRRLAETVLLALSRNSPPG
jgi:hypothetical protein